jgi:hypothetical protein
VWTYEAYEDARGVDVAFYVRIRRRIEISTPLFKGFTQLPTIQIMKNAYAVSS